MKHLWLLPALFAMPVAASDFGERYSAGNIRDGTQAQAALKNADAELARIAQSAKARDDECLRGFLVNSCRDDVRREKELAEREVRRVRVEARDVQRRIEAERVAQRRAEDATARAAADGARPQKELKARAAAQAREVEAKRRDAPPTKEGVPLQGAAQSEEQNRPRQSQPRLSAEERAENARKFQQKQQQAQTRAQEQEAKRKQNEQRRAEKRKQIEEQEAAREETRKKAAESIK